MKNSESNQFVLLGIVGKARGLRGEFFVSDREQLWDKTVTEVYLGVPAKSSFKVQYHKQASQRFIAKLQGIESREQIEKYKLQKIWCDRACIEVDDQVEYLWSDLQDVSVIDINGVAVGVVKGFENFGAHDNIIITHKNSFLELPFINKFFDMAFKGRPESLTLTCPKADVEDLWQDKK